MKAKLLLLEPEAARSEITLSLPAKIGRGDEAKFKLVHARVSRLHCEIFEQGDQVMVRDFASLNGTFVNDERIDDEAPIPSGGILQVGAAKFQVLYGEDFDRAPSPPAAKKAQPGADTVRKAAAKTTEAEEAGELDELWGSMDEESAGAHHGGAAGGGELLDFLDEEPAVKPKPAAKGKAAAGKKGAKKEEEEKPAAEPDEEPSAEHSPADSSAVEDEELKLAPKEEAAKEKPAKASKPKKSSGGEGEEDEEGLDDFLKSIM